MNMNFLQNLVMGFVSGLAEILPISPEAHRALLRTFFGVDSEDAVSRLLIHAACLIALNLYFRTEIAALRRTAGLMKTPPRRRKRPLDTALANTVRLLRGALTVAAVMSLLNHTLSFIGQKLNLLPAALTVNALLLLIPAFVRSGNMDSRNMPRMNGLLMGFGAGLGVVPGISPVAGAVSLGRWQGVDRNYALEFAYILLIPLTAIRMVFDLISIFTGGAASFSGLGLLFALAGAAAAGLGCHLGLKLMKLLSQHSSLTGFAYYSLGTALLCFVLFLMI